MNLLNKHSLSPVIMPLVRLLDTREISWDDREKITAAIRETHEHWDSLEKERQQSKIGAQQGLQAHQGPQQTADGYGIQSGIDQLGYPNLPGYGQR